MAQDASASARQAHEGDDAAFELKGAVSPLTVLRLRSADCDVIEAQLWNQVQRAPQLLANAPVVVDVGALPGAGAALDFARLVLALRRCQVVPVAIANVDAQAAPEAARAGLGTIPLGPAKARRPTTAPVVERVEIPIVEEVEVERIVEVPPPPTMTLRQPVRGGQVVYAQRSDLVVLAAVNPGAQVIADGHIHVYGALRGRALAGAAGQADARIFCRELAAELVSVAGEYLTADEIPESLRRKPAQVFLQDGRCVVAPL